MSAILLVPSVARGNGSGHLSRCIGLAKRLGSSAALYLAERPAEGERSLAELQLSYGGELNGIRVVSALNGERYKLVVLDRRATGLDEYLRWADYGVVVGLDEGGPARPYMPYVIDALPRADGAGEGLGALAANLSDPGILDLPKNRRAEPPSAPSRVLVSFGGEDGAGLTASFCRAAIESGALPATAITAVSGPLSGESDRSGLLGLRFIGPVQNLKERLAGYDLVVTQFGLTAFEAAWAGCAVLLASPSEEHERLARAAGFESLGLGLGDAPTLGARIARAVAELPTLCAKAAAAAPTASRDLSAIISGLAPRHAGACPVCGHGLSKATYRCGRKSYRRCERCGMTHMAYFKEREDPYRKDAYFFEDYKKQYGRSYLEDMPKLRSMAASRLELIEAALGRSAGGRDAVRADARRTAAPRVLDVGCAYGAFLLEAQARGWEVVGSDLSDAAVAYVKGELHIPAFSADFAAAAGDGYYPRGLDCLAMWYVIEHFDELGRVLMRARALLRDGGVFAFSTPSASGVSARTAPASFYERSPDDHFTVWDPRLAAGILKRRGFALERIRVTGHHPERFSGVPDKPSSPLFKAVGLWSRLRGLGDTFECYARKLPDSGIDKE